MFGSSALVCAARTFVILHNEKSSKRQNADLVMMSHMNASSLGVLI